MHPEILGRTLPLNGAGACGAALADLGFRPEILRGFALLARTPRFTMRKVGGGVRRDGDPDFIEDWRADWTC